MADYEGLVAPATGPIALQWQAVHSIHLRLVVMMLAAGCGTDTVAVLAVDVKTDLVPGVEFETIDWSVRPPSDALPVADEFSVLDTHNFISGERVAELSNPASGEHTVAVSLRTVAGTLVARREISAEFKGRNLGVTLTISRLCAGVECPREGDPDNATECRGGQCVACDPDDPASCGCQRDDECSFAADCAVGVCDQGTCLAAREPNACSGDTWCNPDQGCQSFNGCIAGEACVVDDLCAVGVTVCTDEGSACAVVGPRPAGEPCRPATGPCDQAEFCDGESLNCPVEDGQAPAGTACSDGVCDGRGSCLSCNEGDPCPLPDECAIGQIDCSTGQAVCQVASPAPRGDVCRTADGECDVADVCDGTSLTCGDNLFAVVGTVCSDGVCDGLGQCVPCVSGAACGTGNDCERGMLDCSSGTAQCVAAGPKPSGTLCRPAEGECDIAESCDGTSLQCPLQQFDVGRVCNPSAGVCDVAEVCGESPTCPNDRFLGSETVCRSATGDCDVADACDNSGPDCPSLDSVRPRNFLCRASTNSCDPAGLCDGSSKQCPAQSPPSSGIRNFGAGTHSFTVPTRCSAVRVKLWGAGGGSRNNRGGGGGFVSGDVSVAPGETLTIVVATGGRAGASQEGGGGGGGSGVLRNDGTRILIAAGGGGGGGVGVQGGAGGGAAGEHGETGNGNVRGGTGATATSSGVGRSGGGDGTGFRGGHGGNSCNTGVGGTSGSAGEGYRDGGGGGRAAGGTTGNGGGGGGGGLRGGGGGGGTCNDSYRAGGGGGGSSYIAPSVTNSTNQGGVGAVPGGRSDPHYQSPWGEGGDRGGGRVGHAVIVWPAP